MHKGNPGSLGNLGHRLCKQKNGYMGNFPGGLLVKATHFCCGGTASIPGWGTKISYTAYCGKKKKKKNQKNKQNKTKTPKQTNKNTDYMEQVESMSLDFGIQMKGIVLLLWS